MTGSRSNDSTKRPADPTEAHANPGLPSMADVRRIAQPARQAIETLRDGVASAAEPIADRVGQAIEDADVHPEARFARPVQVGLRTIEVADIAGTAVGGGSQRGGDFLPLRPFRGGNWTARWQRLREAQEHLDVVPPVEVKKYAGRYWVEDGHNRVALALYGGQVAIDANVVELVPLGEQRTEPIGSLAASAADSLSVRTAGGGQRASDSLARGEE